MRKVPVWYLLCRWRVSVLREGAFQKIIHSLHVNRGVRVNKYFQAKVWQQPWPLELHTDCEVLGADYHWHKNTDWCVTSILLQYSYTILSVSNAWHPRLNGTIVSSGDNKFVGRNFTLGKPPKRLYSTLYIFYTSNCIILISQNY